MINPGTHDSQHSALHVAQQAIALLLKWTDSDLPPGCSDPGESPVIQRAKELLSWTDRAGIGPLQLLFDRVCLADNRCHSPIHYMPMRAIANSDPPIPYPVKDKPNPEEQTQFKQVVKDAIRTALQDSNNWQNLSLLMLLLEKYGSCLSFGEPDVALVDQVRMTGAIVAAIANDPEAKSLSLIAGDLSGIQNFIYTISSDGALKSLRARSFYLELVTQEIVERLLKKLNLPRTNIIYSGGGNLFLIAPQINEPELGKMTEIDSVRHELNDWMLGRFQGKIFLALDHLNFPIEGLCRKIIDQGQERSFADYWSEIIQKLAQQKLQKFNLPYQMERILKCHRSYEPCKVCHRDNAQTLKPLNDPDSPPACSTCREMLRLGGKLFKVEAVVRKRKGLRQPVNVEGAFTIASLPGYYYYLFSDKQKAFEVVENPDVVFLINNWTVSNYHSDKVTSLLLGNYGQRSGLEEEKQDDVIPGFMTANEFAQIAKAAGCISRVGYLRMDVDHLGQIFAKGLKSLDNQHFLPHLAGLSRQMSYFFKVYLSSLAEDRKTNFLNYAGTYKFKALIDSPRDGKDEKYLRKNLLFIYSGGDDLFVSGSWNEIVEFAFDVYQSFRAYTGSNPDITLSGGISIDDIKFPLYRSAKSSGEAEDLAKSNGRDSLGWFGTALKWIEWLGSDNCTKSHEKILSIIHQADEDYWKIPRPNVAELKLLGVLPFVTRIQQQQLQPNYSRNFVRNLLAAAQLQEQRIEEIEQKRKLPAYENQLQDIRYYLHLPQIAYTLARLPKDVFKDDDFRKSIKHPYNALYFRAIATWIELLTRNT